MSRECKKCGKPAPKHHSICVACLAAAMDDLTVGDIAAVMAGIRDHKKGAKP